MRLSPLRIRRIVWPPSPMSHLRQCQTQKHSGAYACKTPFASIYGLISSSTSNLIILYCQNRRRISRNLGFILCVLLIVMERGEYAWIYARTRARVCVVGSAVLSHFYCLARIFHFCTYFSLSHSLTHTHTRSFLSL